MFLNVSAAIVALLGAVIGGVFGAYAINWFPDKCINHGITTTCESSFIFLNQKGWEATMMLGMFIGIFLAFAVYAIMLFRWRNKKIITP